MPRGQGNPTNIGGQIDPYVQQSVMQNKKAAENRLIAAMQEAGATSRTTMQEQGASERTAMQISGQRQQQAAQLEADDRRAAEAEKARREDMQFSKAMAESSQTFQAEQAKLEREYQDAVREDDRAYLEKLDDKRESLRRFQIEKTLASQERTTNAMLTMIKGSMQKETATEKAKTVLQQEAEKFDKDKDIYERSKNKVRDSVKLDKRMDLPIASTLRERVPTKGQMAKDISLSLPWTMYKTYKTTRDIRKEMAEGVANPMGVLQDQLNMNEAGVSIEDISPETINKLESQILEGKVTPEKIRATLGVLNGMAEALDTKYAETEGKTADFWKDNYRETIRMRDAIEGLSNSTKKISEDDKRTVGSVIRDAIGPIYDSSLGGQSARLRELAGGDFNNVLDEMTKSLQVPSLWEVSPDMSPFDKEIREKENAILLRVYPNLGGTE